jgi:hypothetical protein
MMACVQPDGGDPVSQKSAALAVSRVRKLNRLRERHERLLEQIERNREDQRRMNTLAFAALPEGFAINLSEPMFVVDENGVRVGP